MGSLELYRITPRALPLFAPYLLAEAVQALESGADGVAAVGAVMDGRSCAAAAGEDAGDAVRLRSLYVDPLVRRRGIGRAVTDGLCTLFPAGRPVELRYILPRPETEVMAAFARAVGFGDPREVSRIHRVTLQELGGVPVVCRALQPGFVPASAAVPLYAQPEALLADIAARAPEYLRPDRFAEEADRTLSLGWLSSGRLEAYLVFCPSPVGGLLLSAAYARPWAPAGAFLHLVMAAAHLAAGRMPMATPVYISAVSAQAVGLLRRLTPYDGGCLTEYLAVRG